MQIHVWLNEKVQELVMKGNNQFEKRAFYRTYEVIVHQACDKPAAG